MEEGSKPLRAATPQPLDYTSIFDEEAEMSVLGAALLDKDVVGDLVSTLDPQDFHRLAHEYIFTAIRNLYQNGTAIDLVTVKNELERLGYLDKVGGYDTLVSLSEATPVTSNAPYYAGIVKEKSVLRAVARVCAEISEALMQPGRTAEQVLELAQARMFEIHAKKSSKTALSMRDILEETFKQILDFRKLRDQKERLLGLPTGLIEVDNALCGLQPAYLYVVAGRPGMGKSSFSFRVAENVAVRENKPVLYFSLEMSSQQVCQAMLCSMCKVNSHMLRRGMLKEEEYKSLAIGAGKLSDAPLWIDDSPDLSILDLRSRARRMKQKHNIELIVVDYLQKVRAPGAESRQIEISMVSSQLKNVAKELNIPVIAVAQLNRSPEARTDKKPQLSDLRESGAIEQDADVVMLLYREEYYNPNDPEVRNKCQLTIAKNRTGPAGMDIDLAFIKEWTRFENPATVQAAP